MSIAGNIQYFNNRLQGSGARLVAVSKTKPVELLQQAYNAGQRLFGENKAQEMAEKAALMPPDIEWHFIGHLQTNKVKYIAPIVSLLHSLDSERLLAEVNSQAKKAGRVIPCLLQIYLATEETKFGLTEAEALELLASETFASAENVKIVGLMGLASNTDNQKQVRTEFKRLKAFFNKIKLEVVHPRVSMQELSAGMSNDYQVALQEGSTFVRIGSAVFGER